MNSSQSGQRRSPEPYYDDSTHTNIDIDDEEDSIGGYDEKQRDDDLAPSQSPPSFTDDFIHKPMQTVRSA